MASDYFEDKLIQQTTAFYLNEALKWESVYAYNDETFGPDGLLGRKDESEVILTRSLLTALRKLNPGRQEEGYHQAVETKPSS
jgi:type I restriction enzyme R subunit